MLDIVRTKDGKLWIEDDRFIEPYKIEIEGTIWTRISLMSAGSVTDDGKFIPYESINIVGQQHRLDEIYINEDKKQLSLREILIAYDML